eukprot:Pompholyxophrys_punicea_v1_NODE_689_length_1454_cov_2.851322.p1 type:complete len:183 gc:universal NODE_689_length_1454_cov_2.851322:777-1325(+)
MEKSSVSDTIGLQQEEINFYGRYTLKASMPQAKPNAKPNAKPIPGHTFCLFLVMEKGVEKMKPVPYQGRFSYDFFVAKFVCNHCPNVELLSFDKNASLVRKRVCLACLSKMQQVQEDLEDEFQQWREDNLLSNEDAGHFEEEDRDKLFNSLKKFKLCFGYQGQKCAFITQMHAAKKTKLKED